MSPLQHKTIPFLFSCILVICFLQPVYAARLFFPDQPDTLFQADTLLDTLNSERVIPGRDTLKFTLTEDSPIVRALDSLADIKYFQDYYFTTDSSFLNVYRDPFDPIPEFSDSVYRERIHVLDQMTPIDLVYNEDVKRWILLYACQKQEMTSRILGLAQVYFPLFEEYLDKYNLPLELKYLAIVESALNPTANSRAGAKGLWQFMYNTGKSYGLTVTSYVDDRFDPYKATDAACRHLSDLYGIYEDWLLALAAYNSGSGNVNKAIRRAGNIKNYWAIQPFLPRETQGYVPAFISVCYIMNYNQEHNLYPTHPGILYNGIDTIVVNHLLSFDQLNEMLGIPMEDLTFLNPAYKLGVIPSIHQEPYVLRLPKEYIGPFIANEQALYQFKTQKGIEHEQLMAEVSKVKETRYHKVRRGESLGMIASKYNVKVSDLKKWNHIRGSTIYPGQKLIVYQSSSSSHVTAPVTTTNGSSSSAESPPTESQTITHIVKSGENLAAIASRYGCTVDQLKRWNNLRSTTIYPQQKLTIVDPIYRSDESAASPADSPQQEEAFIYHTVKAGETLWDIANMYPGTTVEKIKTWNHITNAKTIQPGQKLEIRVKE
ncbi:MAG: LysM peptidoglycan-binding domain-containing protein [Bacteroidales bacterium]|nr:LysM peptidoglycan-binding domain-containing protein [Bacteroidales bacterium]